MAEKQVGKLDSVGAQRVRLFLEQKLSQLENLRQLCRKLVNEEFWQCRARDCRILTVIDDDQIFALIVEVAHGRSAVEPVKALRVAHGRHDELPP